jgi:mRNA interferase YafQ
MSDHKYKLDYTTAFSKDLKRVKKRGYDIRLMNDVVNKLRDAVPLEVKNKDHPLTGNWIGYRECHIQPDWLLVYKVYEDKLVLVLTRTGSHSDLKLS